MDVQSLAIYIGVGCFVGFFSGLLGIGGGAMLVPALAFAFAHAGFARESIMHLAMGTTMACILVSTLASVRKHYQLGAVRMDIVRPMSPGIVAGALAGAGIASLLSTAPLKWIFVAFMGYVCYTMAFGWKPKPSHALPSRWGLSLTGATIGTLASLVGVGAAAMLVPFLAWCNVTMHAAIGTSAAVGVPIGLASATGYAIAGLFDHARPAWTLGYIYLPAFIVISVPVVLIAPHAAKLAHRLPVPLLRKIFAGFIAILAIRLAITL